MTHADDEDALAAYDFALPAALIAQEAAEPRDAARLLIADRFGAVRSHARVLDLPSLLPPRALLVVNDSRVVPARLRGTKVDSGGAVELLLTAPYAASWRRRAPTADGTHGSRGDDDAGAASGSTDLEDQPALARSSKPLRVGQELALVGGCRAQIRAVLADGAVRVDLAGAADLDDLLARCGHLPLPPYLRQGREDAAGRDRLRYQTCWAEAPGSVAAPTAGLHFTPALLGALDAAGIERTAVTLHVGPGTFLPVRATSLRDHAVLPERYELSAAAAAALSRARAEGRRVIAVGTTTTRVLETVAAQGLHAQRGWTDLTLRPGHRFALVEGLLTNFHLPRSSLLVLLAAFAGRRAVLEAYAEAVAQRYRFYSYGDASLWL